MASSIARRPRLGELARRFDLVLRAGGDGAMTIAGVCALTPGRTGHMAYAQARGQAAALAATTASAVIVPESLADRAPVPALISARPKLAFAQVAALFEAGTAAAGVHTTAIVDATARIAPSASIGPRVVIGARSVIGERVVLGAGCVVGDDVAIGEATRIASHASIQSRTRLGARVAVEAHAVLGARGFGLVASGEGWQAFPQLGGVAIGDDVEIGAGTTIDRGTFDDTVVEDGVKIDNQVHIGHNCVIGAHTVIAGATGIAGSCAIGRRCMIGGGVGIGDHVRLADEVVLTAASQVPKRIDAPGVYSSTFRAMPARIWRKRLALFRALDRIEARLARIERHHDSNGER